MVLVDLDAIPYKNYGKNKPLWSVITAEVQDSRDKPRLK